MGQRQSRQRDTGKFTIHIPEGGENTKPTRVYQADGSDVSEWHHECEWTSDADAEAAFHVKQKKCKKNPGHKNFIPVGQFNIDHLPSDYREEVIVEWTKLTADLTLKIIVKYTSVDRPETFPDTEKGKHITGYKDFVGKPYPFSKYRGTYSITRTGTASVSDVHRIKGQCKCKVNCPHRDWGIVSLHTARHVVYDDSEAEETKLIFHYDSEEDQKKIRQERPGEVRYINTEWDMCVMHTFSHDVEFLDGLKETLKRKKVLSKKLMEKYIKPKRVDIDELSARDESLLPSFPVIIVSHPHGGSKVVTVGECIQRHDEKEYEYHVYVYTADTCPGSSGAWVCDSYSPWSDRFFVSATHSAGGKDGVNKSGVNWWLL